MGYQLKMRLWRGDKDGGDLADYEVEEEATPTMRDDLIRLFQTDELKKYLTTQELEAIPAEGSE